MFFHIRLGEENNGFKALFICVLELQVPNNYSKVRGANSSVLEEVSCLNRAAGILSVCLICSFSVVSQQWRLCWFYCRSFWFWWLDVKVRCHKIIISEDKCDWFLREILKCCWHCDLKCLGSRKVKDSEWKSNEVETSSKNIKADKQVMPSLKTWTI